MTEIDRDVHKEILRRLESIEASENVRILYACESGSRAWGFPSRDSDYDVRFIYLRPLEWYLSIDVEFKRDVLEYKIEDVFDLSGWDLRKALSLLRKGNPPLIEWLGSPIVYTETKPVIDMMREVAKKYFSPVASLYHYWNMAKGNYRDYLRNKDGTVWLKKYFYVLRPLLAIRWIELGLGVVPTEFGKLLERTIDERNLKSEIKELLRLKISGHELGRGPAMPRIQKFIETEIDRHSNRKFEREFKTGYGPIEEYNKIFRFALKHYQVQP